MEKATNGLFHADYVSRGTVQVIVFGESCFFVVSFGREVKKIAVPVEVSASSLVFQVADEYLSVQDTCL